ncbi:MAG: hypothetical protein E7281_00095 [Lachnospiraceae bacterium]|nr:hypothetical protein [Lachnospiraceae bacterium]
MAIVAYLFRTLKEYLFNNDLSLDRTIFFTVIIGQITIYGILLTFYQFVASYREGEKPRIQYLGTDIFEYYVKKKISVFSYTAMKVILVMWIVEVLYKPVVTIIGSMLDKKWICMTNFIWFGFAILYFLFFIVIFYQCTKCLLTIKLTSDIKRNNTLINAINKGFLKKTLIERVNKSRVELLEQDLTFLHRAILHDDNVELVDEYNSLIQNIFNDYCKRKEKEISCVAGGKRMPKNQVPWISNSDYELQLLQDIIDEWYFQLDEKNLQYITGFYFKLIKLNLERAELAGCCSICLDRYKSLSSKSEEKLFDATAWKDVLSDVFQRLSNKSKKTIIGHLLNGANQEQGLYKKYCGACIQDLIKEELDNVFVGKTEQADFVIVFEFLMYNKCYNDFCAQLLCDRIITVNNCEVGGVINLLYEDNCTYLFLYIVIYYSVYKFRFDWEYINIELIRTLWRQSGSMKHEPEKVLERIRQSNMGHRFRDEMYYKFIKYVQAHPDSEFFKTVYDDRLLDLFYIWVLKICVINQDEFMYHIYLNELDTSIQVFIINELEKHIELMEDKGIYNWINYMRYSTFAIQESIPEKLNITFRNLLLTNLKVLIVVEWLHDNCHLYDNDIGKYLLVKLDELPDKIQRKDQIQKIIKAPFVDSNMHIEEYINMIEKECRICRCKINYVKKELMKEYLTKIIKRKS